MAVRSETPAHRARSQFGIRQYRLHQRRLRGDLCASSAAPWEYDGCRLCVRTQRNQLDPGCQNRRGYAFAVRILRIRRRNQREHADCRCMARLHIRLSVRCRICLSARRCQLEFYSETAAVGSGGWGRFRKFRVALVNMGADRRAGCRWNSPGYRCGIRFPQQLRDMDTGPETVAGTTSPRIRISAGRWMSRTATL